jgi:hypothetical protein
LDEYLTVGYGRASDIARKEAASMPSEFLSSSPEERSVDPAEAVCECPDGCRIDHEND